MSDPDLRGALRGLIEALVDHGKITAADSDEAWAAAFFRVQRALRTAQAVIAQAETEAT